MKRGIKGETWHIFFASFPLCLIVCVCCQCGPLLLKDSLPLVMQLQHSNASPLRNAPLTHKTKTPTTTD